VSVLSSEDVLEPSVLPVGALVSELEDPEAGAGAAAAPSSITSMLFYKAVISP